MPFCTGQGTDDPGGCCYLNGVICPHYRYIDNVHLCNVALRIIEDDPTLLSDRPRFEQTWTDDSEYQRDVRPVWADLEERFGYEPNSYNCSTWNGNPGPACCWLQDNETCEKQAEKLPSTVVALRRAGGV